MAVSAREGVEYKPLLVRGEGRGEGAGGQGVGMERVEKGKMGSDERTRALE